MIIESEERLVKWALQSDNQNSKSSCRLQAVTLYKFLKLSMSQFLKYIKWE